MDEPRSDSDAEPGTDGAPDDGRSPWERALDGPPINPRSNLIYPDAESARARHRA